MAEFHMDDLTMDQINEILTRSEFDKSQALIILWHLIHKLQTWPNQDFSLSYKKMR